jgi:hypothetical protein
MPYGKTTVHGGLTVPDQQLDRVKSFVGEDEERKLKGVLLDDLPPSRHAIGVPPVAAAEGTTCTGKNAFDLSLRGSGSGLRTGPSAPSRTSGFLS